MAKTKASKTKPAPETVRLERARGKVIRYVRLRRDGSTLTILRGKAGEEDVREETERAYDDVEAARSALKAEVQVWEAKGYEEVPFFPEPGSTAVRGRSVSNADLEAAIHRDPTSEDAWRIYADWLTAQGDVRGELISLQRWRVRRPHDLRLSTLESKVLSRYARDLLGPLLPYNTIKLGSGLMPAFRWRNGFLRAVRFWREGPSPTLAQLLELLFSHSASHFVEHVVLGPSAWADGLGYDEALAVLETSAPPSFRALTIAEGQDSVPGNVERALRLPTLRKLKVHHAPLELGRIGESRLESLSLDLVGASPSLVDSLANATWPALRSLSIGAGLVPVFDAALRGLRAPNLRRVSITGATARTFAALAAANIAERVDALELWFPQNLEGLAEHAERFAPIRSIRIQRTAQWWHMPIGRLLQAHLPGLSSFSAKHEPDPLDESSAMEEGL